MRCGSFSHGVLLIDPVIRLFFVTFRHTYKFGAPIHGVLLIDPRSPDCFSSRFVTHTNLEHRYNLRHGDSDRRFITGLGRRHRLVWLTQSCAHACRQCAPHRSAHGRTPPCRRRSPRRRAHAWPPPCRPHTHRTGDSLVPQRADLRATYNERYIRAELSLPRTREPPSASRYRSDVPMTGRVGGTSLSVVCECVCLPKSQADATSAHATMLATRAYSCCCVNRVDMGLQTLWG